MLNSIQILAAKTALKKMFSDGYFSICTIDNILKMSGGIARSDDYQTLSVLHCVKFSDMPQELLLEVPKLIKRIVESPGLTLETDFIKEIKLIK